MPVRDSLEKFGLRPSETALRTLKPVPNHLQKGRNRTALRRLKPYHTNSLPLVRAPLDALGVSDRPWWKIRLIILDGEEEETLS